MTHGILLVDKPGGITSHDVVASTRRALATRKVGHAGTLDPMATGLLVLGAGNATRLLHYLVGLDKEYEATIRLGWATTTDDAEGEVLPAVTGVHDALSSLTGDLIRSAVVQLTGEISQIPSSVSAIKVDGVRAYKRARSGEEVLLVARAVTVSEFEVLRIGSVTDLHASENSDDEGRPFLDIDVRVQCSSGTYIRALARDLGASLGCGGHLTVLRRTKVGQFSVLKAHKLETISPDFLIRPAIAARTVLPVLSVNEYETTILRHGKRLPMTDFGLPQNAPLAAVSVETNELVAVVERRGEEAVVLAGFPSEFPQEGAQE